MSISFQVDEEGLSHQFPMPEAPGPEALVDENEIRAEQAKSWPPEFQENFSDSSAIQVRPVEPMDLMHPAAKEPQQMVWMKTRERLPDDPRVRRPSALTMVNRNTTPILMFAAIILNYNRRHGYASAKNHDPRSTNITHNAKTSGSRIPQDATQKQISRIQDPRISRKTKTSESKIIKIPSKNTI